MGLIYGKHTSGWRNTYEFVSEEDKKNRVEEKIELLKDFMVENAESYFHELYASKTPSCLDKTCRTIIFNNL